MSCLRIFHAQDFGRGSVRTSTDLGTLKPAIIDDVLLGRRGPDRGHDDGVYPLTPTVVGNPDHRNLGHRHSWPAAGGLGRSNSSAAHLLLTLLLDVVGCQRHQVVVDRCASREIALQ
jgi:hypothetical protein